MKRPQYIRGEKVVAIQVLRSFFYVVIDKEQHRPIGYMGMSKLNELVGLFIEPAYREKGFATDLVNATQKVFHSLNFTVSPENIPMQALLEKLGYEKWFKFEKVSQEAQP